jgi:HEAT repeat protein
MSFLLPPLPPTFEAALRDVVARAPELRIAAAERLGEAGPEFRERAIGSLHALAEDPDPRVRGSAVKALGLLADFTSLPTLRERLDDPDAAVRELAVVALEALELPGALDALRDALGSHHPEVRFQAVVACVQRDPGFDAATVRALLADPDGRVRANAARAYAGLAPPPAPDSLYPLLDDPLTEVRYEAALGLARLGSTAGLSVLLETLADPEHVLDALDALGGLDCPQASEPIRRLTLSVLRPLVVKVAAARALLRLGDPHGATALREVLRAWRSDGRAYAVEVASELQVRAVEPELVRLLRRPRGVDPERVRAALERLRA